MNRINLIFTLPDDQSHSWTHWREIQHYGGWLRHIGDFHSDITIGGIRLDPWNGKEKRRAKEISNQYSSAHAVGAAGPNDTVKVAYRYKKEVRNFSLSRKEVSDIKDEVLSLVSKQMEIVFEVTCGTCGSSTEDGLVTCEHVDYSGMDTETPAALIRPPNTEVTAIFQFRSDVSKGTRFTQGILMPTLAKGADIEQLASPVGGGVNCATAQRDRDRIRVPFYKPSEGPTGVMREVGIFSEDTLLFYGSI